MNQDLISIITPIYNAEEYLSKMLDSVCKQTYSRWELILVNDGSTDLSVQIISEFERKDKRIRCLHQSNAGPAVARNKGIEEAKGTYLSFIDADDWVSPLYLEKLIEPMLKFSTDMVCAGYHEMNSKFPEGLELHDFDREAFNQNLNKKAYQSNIFEGLSGVLWSKLFKKEIFTKNSIKLIPRMRLSEDLIAVLEYSKYIKSAYIIPDAIYYYNRLDDVGLSNRLKISTYEAFIIFLEEIEKHRDELNFIDLDAVLNKRKYAVMIKILKDNVHSKNQFFKVADFLVQNEASLHSEILQNNKFDYKILKWIFAGKIFRAWVSLRIYDFLKKIKHG